MTMYMHLLPSMHRSPGPLLARLLAAAMAVAQAAVTVLFAFCMLVGPSIALGFVCWVFADRLGFGPDQALAAGLAGWLLAALITVGLSNAPGWLPRVFSRGSAPARENRT